MTSLAATMACPPAHEVSVRCDSNLATCAIRCDDPSQRSSCGWSNVAWNFSPVLWPNPADAIFGHPPPPVECESTRSCGPKGGAIEVLTTALLGVPVLKVTGDLDHLSAPTLEGAIEDIFGTDAVRLLVDLVDCPYLDSGGLSVLLYTVREVRGKGWIGVVSPSRNLSGSLKSRG